MDSPSHDCIVRDPAILTGTPVIRGTRLSVELIVGLMVNGWTETDICANYPGIGRDAIAACLAYALDDRK